MSTGAQGRKHTQRAAYPRKNGNSRGGRPQKEVSAAKKRRIVRLYDDGESLREIERRTGLTYRLLKRVLNERDSADGDQPRE